MPLTVGPPTSGDVDAGVIDDARARQRRHRGVAAVGIAVVAGVLAVALLESGASGRRSVARHAPAPAPATPVRGAGGITYTVGVTPPMKAGVVGWCLAFTEHYPRGGGGGGVGCGGTVLGAPFVASQVGGFGSHGESFVDYVYVTTAQVAAVRISPTLTIRTHRDPRLPDADRIAVGVVRGNNPVTRAPVALTTAGSALPSHPLRTLPSEPTEFWQHRPAPPAVCELGTSKLAGAEPTFGEVAPRLRAFPQVASGTLVSCDYMSFTVTQSDQTDAGRATINAAVLLNARSPGRPPGPLPGATAVPHQPRTVNEPATRTGINLAITARRVGNAWLIIETNGTLASRLNILNRLTTCVRLSGPPCRSPHPLHAAGVRGAQQRT